MVRLFHHRQRLLAFVFTLALGSTPLIAQDLPPVAGTVVDPTGAGVAGARVALIDDRGRTVRATSTDGAGAFSVYGMAAGAYQLVIEVPAFVPASVAVTVPSVEAQSVRVVLAAGGFAERVVVTARRDDARVSETPRAVSIVDSRDIERSVSSDLTDVLKKSAGVDVIQFPGVLSGIGIRGFRPQFSGINKRSLLLIDGRPSGITNLATLRLDGVERVEVVKGAASSIYGSSAMGGVVNVITRQSRGPVGGAVRFGTGSFGLTDMSGRIGGSLTPKVDIDVNGSLVDQRRNFRMGNGEVRPATSFSVYEGAARVGVDLSPAWRLTARGHGYRGRDIMTPGDLASGINSQGSKDLEVSSQEARLLGTIRAHRVALTGYRAGEASHTSNVTSFNPADAPFLPYLSFENTLDWTGFQARDAWTLSRVSGLVVGVDYERVTSIGRSYTRTGTRAAPFSADARRQTTGVYAEHTLTLRDGRTVISTGGRLDAVHTATLDTPFKTNFTPSEADFTVFNPSAGLSHALGQGTRLHATVGRAFIPAEASQLTGFTTSTIGGRTQITQGNPNLLPERSNAVDAGVEWTSRRSRVDVTAFRTVVSDRFISNVVTSSPPPPDPIIVSVRNGLDARLSGIEFEGERELVGGVRVFSTTTHYIERRERLVSGASQDALNVPRHSLRFGIDSDLGRLTLRLTARHVRGARDNNFNLPGFPIVDRDNFTVTDLALAYRLSGPHAIGLDINNLFDRYYYETLGYPLQGVSFRLSYRAGF